MEISRTDTAIQVLNQGEESHASKVDKLLDKLSHNSRTSGTNLTTISAGEVWTIRSYIGLQRLAEVQLENEISKLVAEKYNVS
jgi:chromosomal replication initiation ATPase DnaA